MLKGEENHNRIEAVDGEVNDRLVAVEDSPMHEETINMAQTSTARRRASSRPQAHVDSFAAEAKVDYAATDSYNASRNIGPGSKAKWWVLAAASAIVLIILTVAGIYLITKEPSTVDQLVILTVPSGAEVKLDEKVYGNSPVKLEQLPIGTYTLTITKEGFEPIVEQITVTESQPLERKLIPLQPSDSIGLSPAERINQYKQKAEEAFNRGHYGRPFESSALYYVVSIEYLDSTNKFAGEMRQRIQKTLHQSAQSAMASNDYAQAQEAYALLKEHYPDDEEARIAAAKLENLLSARRGDELRELVRRAEDALKAGKLLEPSRASAYYYANQALAIDRQNAQARAVRNQVRDFLTASVESYIGRSDFEAAAKQLERVTQLFSDEKQLRDRLRALIEERSAEHAKANNSVFRRQEGLKKYSNGQYEAALPDLLFALTNNQGTPDVIFAIANSNLKLNRLDLAASYFRRIPASAGEPYISSIASLGEIAFRSGNTSAALDHFRNARQLGGSTMYPIAVLDDKIESIEKRQREKAAEPNPLTIQVKHLHGALQGSCKGTLVVDQTGVRYDGSKDSYSWNVLGVALQTAKNKITINKSHEFSVTPADAERFRETLAKYQNAANR